MAHVSSNPTVFFWGVNSKDPKHGDWETGRDWYDLSLSYEDDSYIYLVVIATENRCEFWAPKWWFIE